MNLRYVTSSLSSSSVYAVSVFAFLFPAYALAAELENPLSVESIQELLQAIVAVVIVFATPIVIFFIIYAGFLYVTARGNEQQLQQASRALLYALVGGLLILGAFVIIEVISNLIGAIAGA